MSGEFKMEENQSMRHLLKQTHISVTIMAISLCTGLIEARALTQVPKIADAKEAKNAAKELADWQNTCQNTVPFVGVILMTTIAEFGGRRAAITAINLLTALASSLSIPGTKLCLKLVYIASAMSSGGQIVLFYLCIAEYCEPKHRLVFSIANVTVNRIGFIIEKIVYAHLDKVDIAHYVQYFEVFLATVCLASLSKWPESPYWLALKGRQDRSMSSFLLLKCDNSLSETELTATIESRNRPDSFKLFALPLFTSIVLSSTFWCSVLFLNEHKTYWPLSSYDYNKVTIELFIIFALRKGVLWFYEYGKIVIILALISFASFQYASTIFFFYIVRSGGSMTGNLDIMDLDIRNPTVFWSCYKLIILGPTTFSISKFADCVPLKRRSLFMCISGVTFFLVKIIYTYTAMVIKEKFGNIVMLLVLTKLIMLGIVFLVGFLVPRTEGKTLTEIEKMYLKKKVHNDI